METVTSTPESLAAEVCSNLACYRGKVPEFANRTKFSQVKDCPDCNGTSRRYPTLSVECPCPEQDTPNVIQCRKGKHTIDCRCNGAGRIPDVTVEKLLAIPETMGLQVVLVQEGGGNPGWAVSLNGEQIGPMSMISYTGRGDTPLNALAAVIGSATREA